jgi:uncharacterized membrane protein YgcG
MVAAAPRQSIPRPAIFLRFGVAALALAGLAGRVSAQQYPAQDWPPDDPVNSPAAPPQQYAPQQYQQQPYGYAPQQYPQQAPQPQQYGYAPQQYPQNPGYQQPYPQQGYGQQLASSQQPMSPAQLAQLLAPIALYPDALVAQILAASTYPAQVSAADQWLHSMGNAPPDQIAARANAQTSWDPSVKALTAFPQVLAMLDRNLQWTTTLGNAYYNQPQDVLQTVQVLRQRAEQAGNLESTPQEEVSENEGAIDIAPADPQMVYVPSYNPWDVYGQPVSPYPGFSLLGTIGSFLGSALINFGPGIAMHAFMATPFGWLGWGLDWLAHAILFNHNDYWTHSTSVRDWGFPSGGPRWHGGADWAHNGGGWNRDGGHGNYAGNNGGMRPRGGPTQPYNSPRTGENFNAGNFRPRGEPAQPYADARSAEGFNRGYPSRNEAYGRPALPSQGYYRAPQAYGRSQQNYEPRQQAYAARPEQFGRQGYGSPQGYGSNFAAAPRDSYAPRQGGVMTYANPTYRAPQNSYRGDIGGRSYGGSSESFSGSQHSGGFHLFGGGHSSDNYKAPKAYNYGGGHSAWGGSSHGFGGGGSFKAPKAPKMPKEHSSGGHSGGGGHSSHHH